MDASFIPIEVTPSQTPFGFDQLRRSFKSALSAEAALLACPFVGTADEVFPNMFLMPISTPESAQSATRVELVYMGFLRGPAGIPQLPHQKHDSENAVQSASSNYGSGGAAPVTITIQYYAPSNTLSYVSSGAAGTAGAADPGADPVVIAVTVGGTNFTPTSIPDIVSTYFSSQIVAAITSTEIVPGKYWQNVARKTKVYIPYMVNIVPGTAIIQLAVPGSGYSVGNILTITAGGETAALVITALGGGRSVLSWNVTSNTFTTAHTSLPASGGSGTGAAYNVAIL